MLACGQSQSQLCSETVNIRCSMSNNWRDFMVLISLCHITESAKRYLIMRGSAKRYLIMRESGSSKSPLLIALQGQVCPETMLGQVSSQLQDKETC